uniref:Uncharacterized protein n=1 Tax=Kalanchoe fedtschenkoi TaxID=63787 RepID=A0A7N0UUM7_KALFE
MDAKTKINQYRERLDKTLACDNLTDEKTIRTIVKTRLLQSPGSGNQVKGDVTDFLEKRTKELTDFLGMLRSASPSDERNSRASGASNAEWKVKQDDEECRIMYREGPAGTPFHVLLAEGYLDGPVDACLCVAWETTLYKKWWPQFNYPTFKVISSRCVHKVGAGEQISVVRLKAPWPLSVRQALLHYYEFEFFQEDLVVVKVKTIDDVERDGGFYGITNDLIPESKDAVRIDLVGGLVIQKVNNERCYFRSIFNVDIKLDFVPPSLINFIARQLIGNGFKLCQKTMAAIAKGDKDFSKALEDPMYERIRQAIHFPGTEKVQEPKIVEINEGKSVGEDGSLMKTSESDASGRGHDVDIGKDSTLADSPPDSLDEDLNAVSEIKEISILAETTKLKDDNARKPQLSSYKVAENFNRLYGRGVCPRPEVEQALGTLDRVIKAVRELHISSGADKRCLEVVRQKPTEIDLHQLTSTAPRDVKSGFTAGNLETSVIERKSTDSHQESLPANATAITAEKARLAENVTNNIANIGQNVNGIYERSVENVKLARHRNPNTVCLCWPYNPRKR